MERGLILFFFCFLPWILIFIFARVMGSEGVQMFATLWILVSPIFNYLGVRYFSRLGSNRGISKE